MCTTDKPTTRLVALLDSAAEQRTREYWERYMKGTARFRGVPMAGVRTAVRTVWREQELVSWTTPDLLSLAHRWFAQEMSEDKLAAILLITEHLGPRLGLGDVEALGRPFTAGHITDWGICDWYATKALHGFITGEDTELRPRAEAIAAWSTASGLWQRRASVVAFVRLAAQSPDPFDGCTDLLLDTCAANLVSGDRFAHTGPAWLLRELSRHHPERVADFVRQHPELSPEATRMATARLRPGPYRRR
ncbi:DNA alkylation repair protein [Streptomyces sp. NPDC051738]|uniref:DNA alkylation repair protein n=1 Tax=Streptomyces sp. NPDC051738 TaxID=3365672 RepID=UPI0037CD482D